MAVVCTVDVLNWLVDVSSQEVTTLRASAAVEQCLWQAVELIQSSSQFPQVRTAAGLRLHVQADEAVLEVVSHRRLGWCCLSLPSTPTPAAVTTRVTSRQAPLTTLKQPWVALLSCCNARMMQRVRWPPTRA